MRIGIFSAYYLPHLGGVERYTSNLARGLASANHSVTVITSSHGGRRPQFHGIEVIEVPSVSIMNDRFPLIIPGPAFWHALRKLYNYHFDAIVINTRYYPLCLLGKKIAENQRLNPIVIDHSSGYISDDTGFMGKIMRLYERAATRLIRRGSTRFSLSLNAESFGFGLLAFKLRVPLRTVSTLVSIVVFPANMTGEKSSPYLMRRLSFSLGV